MREKLTKLGRRDVLRATGELGKIGVYGLGIRSLLKIGEGETDLIRGVHTDNPNASRAELKRESEKSATNTSLLAPATILVICDFASWMNKKIASEQEAESKL